VKRTEYAAAEVGYEHEAEWTEDRRAAEFENEQNSRAGLDSYVIARTVTLSPWRPARSDAKARKAKAAKP
jgi:hypothetical protein